MASFEEGDAARPELSSFSTEYPLKPENDQRACQVFAFLLSFVLMSFTCAFGFVGNYLSVVTLNRDRSLRTSVTKFLLTMLAVADMAFLVPVVFVIMIPAYCSFQPLTASCAPAVLQAIPYVEQYGWALASAAHMCTVYVTVLVAVHRFVYVCRPHDTERLSGLQRAKLHVAAVPLFAFFYNLPRVFEYKLSVSGGGGGGDDDDDIMSTVEMTTRDFSGCSDAFATVMSVSRGFKERDKLQFSAVGGSPWFQIAYKNVCFYLFMYIIPLTTLVFVTFRLIATLRMRKNSKYRKSVVASPVTASASATVPPPPPVTMLNRRQQSRDDNVTIVLIIVIAVFIVCQTPTLVQRLLLAVTGIDSRACGHPYYYIERLADYLAIFNSCVNFVVYVIFAPRFRRILVNEVLPMRTTGSSSLTCCCGIGRRGGHRCSRSIGGATACGDNKGRSGTGGSDYCSEMAECFGVSSSQQFDSSAKDNYHQQQQLQNTSVVGLKTVATVAACGRCEATIIADSSNVDRKQIHRLPLTSSSAVGTMDDVDKDEISSSISSAGSSSILPSIQCYGGLCDAVTADHAT